MKHEKNNENGAEHNWSWSRGKVIDIVIYSINIFIKKKTSSCAKSCNLKQRKRNVKKKLQQIVFSKVPISLSLWFAEKKNGIKNN